MLKKAFYGGIALLIWISVYFFPEHTISPGRLASAHNNLSNNCSQCHSPLTGVQSENCSVCHSEKKGNFITAGLLPGKSMRVNHLHKNLEGMDCITCHSEHNGVSVHSEKKKFSHDLLIPRVKSDCISCHTEDKPKNEMHSKATDCGVCHQTINFTYATFNHSSLSQDQLLNCSSCHTKPTDDYHSQITQDCSSCHTVESWNSAISGHNHIFQFDSNHPQTCQNCHTQKGNYKVYSCMNCHEHNEQKMIRKHSEEGIYDISNCVKCHTSGSENEGGDD
mgnify:FL=1